MRLIRFVPPLLLALSGCGIVYHSPSVPTSSADGSLSVVDMDAASVQQANATPYVPRPLPAIFSQTGGTGTGMRGAGPVPDPVLDRRQKPMGLTTRLPPAPQPEAYRIGVGDEVLLATPQVGSTVEQLTGLLAAQNARQGYTVQDDGAIAIPNVGRVQISGMTLEEAEAELFQRLVENQIDPSFSLEIADFNSRKVSIGGAVAQPAVAPVTLTPLYLDAALAAAGGVTVEDMDYASVRIYRDGGLYQVPLTRLYGDASLPKIQLVDGDSVFVDTAYDLDLAQAYFAEQIQLAQFRQASRIASLNELNSEVALRRGELEEARANFRTRLELESVDRDYVYLSGEVKTQTRYPLPFGNTATLADALFSSGGIETTTGNLRQIYVIRGSEMPGDPTVTAWRLDAANATNMLLATRFELRPNDIVFVAEQPVTRWNRVIQQITPSLINASVAAVD
ncbi:polysaccharide biosynthesis/export family protein [Pseudooceanicola aestuarii]|uniref:polysaccharide biosynthesis/export family protein n=1 Tax=Pseudooceanicola aestuarii TaxID=2697319 RepID=UPI0013D1ECD6|nr:polysaccharide biosynthesis/export family protein [Pseudooceanicola aestuarii]